jgi:hypothetical protein
MILPGTSKADDKDAATGGAISQLDGWTPPQNVYSLSTIGRYVDVDGQQMKCYTAQEGKAVLLPMFADYRSLHRTSWLWWAAKNEYDSKVSAMATKLSIQAGTITFYKDESEHWWKVARSKARQYELSQKWSWVPWALVVVESVAFGVLGFRAMGIASAEYKSVN